MLYRILLFFCQTSTWISHRYTYIPSLLDLPPCLLPIPPVWGIFNGRPQSSRRFWISGCYHEGLQARMTWNESMCQKRWVKQTEGELSLICRVFWNQNGEFYLWNTSDHPKPLVYLGYSELRKTHLKAANFSLCLCSFLSDQL